MSIVEKALSKLRPDPEYPLREGAETGPVRLERRVSVEAAASNAPAKLFEPKNPAPVQIDLHALREQRVLAADSRADSSEEQFRRVKWPLLEQATGRRSETAATRGRLIMVTSALADEGKSFCSLGLALSIARERDLAVLLVDADARKAGTSQTLGVISEPGLVDLVESSDLTLEDVVRRTNIPSLYLLPAGRRDADVPELWASKRMAEIMARLAFLDERMVVVIDSSPVLLTNETQVLSRLVGQVVFVIRANKTPQSAVREAIQTLDGQARVACLLNRSSESFGKYYAAYAPNRGSAQEGQPR